MGARIIASFIIGAIFSACIIFLVNGIGTPALAGTECPDDPLILSGIPDVRQAEYYSCGTSSF